MAYSFADLLEPLAAAGRRAIVLELPGHALSDKPLDERAYTLAAMTDVVEETLSALGLPHVDVVGHSMGSAIALELARRTPARIGRLALVSPLGLDRIRVTALSRGVSPRMMMRMLPAAVPRAAVKAVLRMVHGRRRPPTERDVDHYWAPTAFPEFGFAMIALLRRFDWSAWPAERLTAVRAPVLVVTGRRDPLVRHGAVTARAKALHDARVIVLPDVGHVPLAEAPEETVPAIVTFLSAEFRGGNAGTGRGSRGLDLGPRLP